LPRRNIMYESLQKISKVFLRKSQKSMKYFFLLATATLICVTFAVTPDNVSSRLMIHIPHKLFRAEGYDHREALFGIPPYGGSISTNIYYAKSELCDPNRQSHYEEEEKKWPSPFILMVDRGGCTFVKKVRNAQRLGAAGVIVADNSCLCSDIKCVESSDIASCETSEPIMADDGSGSDISIPSFLTFKYDADKIKAELLADNPVQIEMAWSLPAPDDRVEYDMWTVPTDMFVDHEFFSNLKEIAVALDKSAYFTPHMHIFDGHRSHCHGKKGMNQCYSLCTNKGRYCATDPDSDLEKGISGADVVKESLRRLCIWQQYGDDNGIGVKWWDYVIEFMKSCNQPDKFMKDECVQEVYKHAVVDAKTIENCMEDNGGLTEDRKNKLLESELKSQEERGIVILPTVVINSAAIRGALTVTNIFDAICAGFATGSKPEVCQQCERCDDPNECIKEKGVCKTRGIIIKSGVSPFAFSSSILSIFGMFISLGFWYYKKARNEMRHEVRGLLAEYMPLEEDDI